MSDSGKEFSPYETKFLARYDLHTCKKLLEQLNEPHTWFAYQWEYSVKATITEVDENHAKFKIWKTPKSIMGVEASMGASVQGTLTSQGDSRTLVSGKAQIDTGFYCGLLFFIVPSWVVFATLWAKSLSTSAIWIVIGGVAISLLITYAHMTWLRGNLIDILTTALRRPVP